MKEFSWHLSGNSGKSPPTVLYKVYIHISILKWRRGLSWPFRVVKTLPFNAGDAGSIPGLGARVHMPNGQKNENMKQKQYCNKSIKTLKKWPTSKKKKKKAFLTLRLIFFSILGRLRRNESFVLSSNTITPLFHLRKSFHVSRSLFHFHCTCFSPIFLPCLQWSGKS